MDSYQVKRQHTPVNWSVEVPGSKSITNRALLMAALSQGTVVLHGVLFSDDSRVFLAALQSLGYQVQIDEETKTVAVQGNGGSIPADHGEIYVGSAGTAARFLTAMLGISGGTYTIRCSDQMKKRPMRSLFEALLSLGAQITWLGEEWHLPVEMTGAGADRADSQEMRLELDISQSTQFLSAFLLIAPMFHQGLRIRITSEKKDGSYIRITRNMMKNFGVETAFAHSDYVVAQGAVYGRPEGMEYQIEPDISAACYFYAAAAITGGYAKVLHVHSDSMQGDLRFLDVLEQMGCTRTEEADGIAIQGPDTAQGLRGISVDMNDFSDQALTLAAIAPYADAPVEIRHIAHIRGQESDRLHAIVSNLQRAGIQAEEYPDGVKICPGQPQACDIETFEDHRVAMAFAILGLRADGIRILNPMCCQKTFETFFDLLDTFLV